MSFGIDELERNVETLEDEVEQYEGEAQEAHERRQAVEGAIERLGADVELVEQLGANRRDAERVEEDISQERSRLAGEVSQLAAQLHQQLESLHAERSTLQSLVEIGEDVSEGMATLDERQRWLEDCEQQLELIGNRLDVALEAYDLVEGQASGKMPSERGAETRESPLQGHAYDEAPVYESELASVPTGDFTLPVDPLTGLDAGADLSAPVPPSVDVRYQPVMSQFCDELAEWRQLADESKVKAMGQHTLTTHVDSTSGNSFDESEFMDWYVTSYRDVLQRLGISEQDLASFDNEFLHTLSELRGDRDTSRWEEGTMPGQAVTPGYGPSRRPSAEQLEWARSRSADEELHRKVSGLLMTAEPMHIRPDGSTLYDSPGSMSGKLNYYQGLSSADWQGTCGLCSVQNLGCMAGKRVSEADLVALARAHGLCSRGLLLSPGERGGTSPEGRRQLLSLIGIESHIDMNHDVDHIAGLVEDGRGVIASVDVSEFWRGAIPYDQAGGHAVTITSVERDSAGKPVRFHLCDSGLHDPDYTIDVEQFERSLRATRGLNVTNETIR